MDSRVDATGAGISIIASNQVDELLELAQFRLTQECEDALALIAPDDERRAECEREICNAIRKVRIFAASAELFGSQPDKRAYQRLAKKLRGAEIALAPVPILPVHIDTLRDSLKSAREFAENMIREFGRGPKSFLGRAPTIAARREAVAHAHDLLENYGRRSPGRSKNGPWVRLANIFFPDGNLYEEVRNFNSGMKRTRPRKRRR